MSRIESRGDAAEVTVAQLMGRLARFGDRPALVSGQTKTTYVQLDEQSTQFAGTLVERSLGPGERVALALGTGFDIIPWYLACAKAGLVAVPLPERLTDNELHHQINDSGAVALVFSAERADTVARVRARLPTLALREVIASAAPSDVFEEHLLARAPSPGPTVQISPQDPFCIMYTGGSTGTSKAALQTHRSWACAIESVAEEWALGADDVHLHVLPLTHVSWFSLAAHLYVGAKTIRLSRWDPVRALQTVQEQRVTVLNLIPTMLGDLLLAAQGSDYDLSSVRQVTTAGSAMPSEMYDAAVDVFGERIGAIYGMTETSGPVTFVSPADMGTATLRCAGKPGRYTTIGILDDACEPLPPDVIGEICLQGPQVTGGYVNQREETQAAFEGGWFHTGDVGYVDGTGFLFIVDRKKDMIKTGGENVASREVEEVLYQHPAVSEVAVFATPHERWIEAVTAAVVVREGQVVSVDELIAFARDHLAGFKVPKRIVLVDALPKNASGKVLKRELRAALDDGTA
ncbi:MAG: long-chain fatty acid--CoA ligase [Acidimicrobiales bacterium]